MVCLTENMGLVLTNQVVDAASFDEKIESPGWLSVDGIWGGEMVKVAGYLSMHPAGQNSRNANLSYITGMNR